MLYYHTTFHLCKHGRVVPILLTYFFFFNSTSDSLGTLFIASLHALFIYGILHLYYITPQPYHLLFFCLFQWRDAEAELGRLGYSYSSYDI